MDRRGRAAPGTAQLTELEADAEQLRLHIKLLTPPGGKDPEVRQGHWISGTRSF